MLLHATRSNNLEDVIHLLDNGFPSAVEYDDKDMPDLVDVDETQIVDAELRPS